MSDVAAAPPQPASDDSQNPAISPNSNVTVGIPIKHSIDDPEPSTVTNGPAGQPLQATESAHPSDVNVNQLPKASYPADHDSSADKEDEELYGVAERSDGDAEKANDKSDDKQIDELDDKLAGKNDDSDDDPFADLDDVATMDLYDLANYTFGKKNEECKSRFLQELPKHELSAALEKRYAERGMRRSVGAVILVHSHNFPHILLLQRSDGKGEYALPGGRLRPGESEEDGLQRKLASKLRPNGSISAEEEEQQQLDVGEKLCTWHAIDFTRKYYPYVPAHVTKPKEVLNVYAVSLPSKFMFAVPKNLQLVAVPLFEVFSNAATYGDIISAIPALLSRFHVNYC